MDWAWARILFTVLVFVSFMLVILIVSGKHNRSNYQDDDDTPRDTAQPNRENGA